jgi:hypothetical protein
MGALSAASAFGHNCHNARISRPAAALAVGARSRRPGCAFRAAGLAAYFRPSELRFFHRLLPGRSPPGWAGYQPAALTRLENH